LQDLLEGEFDSYKKPHSNLGGGVPWGSFGQEQFSLDDRKKEGRDEKKGVAERNVRGETENGKSMMRPQNPMFPLLGEGGMRTRMFTSRKSRHNRS